MDEGLKNLIYKAEQGNVEAMCMVGDCYNRGFHAEKNDEQAYQWYKMAADKGSAAAEFLVGLDFLDGVGVEKDKQKAFKYIKSAADKGVVGAQHILAMMYQSGELGFWRKYQKAAFYFEKAAKQGNAEAQLNLGDLYMIGKGVAASVENGLFWITCAYMHGEKCPEVSKEALERLNRLISLNFPGGRKRIDSMIEKIKTQYPSYYL